MQYDELEYLRTNHSSWVLLRSQHAALVLDFLGRTFVDENVGAVSASALNDQLEDELFALNQRFGEGTFARSASAYLNEWSDNERGWLRKFYPSNSDEPHYDLSPSVEKALLWVRDLRARDFVGTESRLNTAFELLRQMIYGADNDPQHRLDDLHRRRSEIDAEIARVERGEIVVLDAVSQRDRYQQFARMARELLADFRQVEENFRNLDRGLRETIAGWSGAKGDLLDEVLGSRSSIAESDQGRSFQAFYDFLLSHQRQEELTDLLDRLRDIDQLPEQDERLTRIHFEWIDASERTQATVRLLSEQLRRFLDDQVWLENRRVFDLLRNIEIQALELRHETDLPITMDLEETAVTVVLPFERPLYRPQHVTPLDSESVQAGNDEFDTSSLHSQLHVDRDELRRTVRRSLQQRTQVSLSDVVEAAPLEQGLAELITYLSLDDSAFTVVFDEERRASIEWTNEDVQRVADMPAVTFSNERSDSNEKPDRNER
jgi:hypothetical protein